MDENERLAKLEQAKERHERWLEDHNRRIAELFKGREDHLALLADHEWLILENQRRTKDQEEWFAKMDLIAQRTELNLQEATDKLNALIHWDMQRHGYPEGGNPPTE